MKGYTKLIDIHDQAHRLHEALEKFFVAHSIPFRRSHFKNDGFVRYSVPVADFSAANAGIPALVALAKGGK